MLAEKWQFSPKMIQCIRNHHIYDKHGTNAMAECLEVADRISEKLGYDSRGNLSAEAGEWVLPKRFCDNLDEVIETLGDTDKIIEDAKQYSQAA
jgi:HD-like signal output (HDOD) protein